MSRCSCALPRRPRSYASRELAADDVGPTSIRKALVLLRGVLQRACESGRLTSNPAESLKFAPRREASFNYRSVIHGLRTNEWVLHYRELGDRLLDWAGPDESRFEPPEEPRRGVHEPRYRRHGDYGWQVNDVADGRFRPVQPDALLDVSALGQDVRVFVECDRTGRVDKNYDKFLR